MATKQILDTNAGISIDPANFDLFPNFQVPAIAGVRVHYIGQGDAISLIDDSRQPILYLDYGGFGDHPDKPDNFPNTASRLPVRRSDGKLVTIVLTHWDKDHYYSATKVPESEECRWVTPRQKVGVQASTFSAKIENMFSWPEDKVEEGFAFPTDGKDFVMLEKIKNSPVGLDQTEDRNHSGLVMSVVKVNSDPEVKNQLIILPGDAPFNEIHHLPTLRQECTLSGVVAYHHGSHTSWKNNQTNGNVTGNTLDGSFNNPKLVFSFGPNNTYGHPDESNYDGLTFWTPTKIKTPPVFHGNNYPEFIDILF